MSEEDKKAETVEKTETIEEEQPDCSSEELSVEELKRLLEEAQSQADEHKEKMLRAHAELDNIKKRHQQELEKAHKYGLEKFVAELLGIWDSLELGFSAAQQSQDLDKLLEGMELTLKMMHDTMAKFGVEQIDPLGQPFNPDYHQAIGMEQTDEYEPNTVSTVIQKGYTLNGRVIRPALVKVAQA